MSKAIDFKPSRLVRLLAISIFSGSTVFSTESKGQETPSAIAEKILDDTQPAEARQKLAAEAAGISDELIRSMTLGLDSQPDLKEEYRRIPWIWRVAVAAGKRNQDDEILKILEVSLPAYKAKFSLPSQRAKLRDWQAVVIGGGIINGIGLVGGWPAERIPSIIGPNADLRRRWAQVQDLASEMAEDERVFKGTRYDAIRILGVGKWDQWGGQIFKYLLKGVDDELQMGAISALGDMRSPSVGQALLSGITHYSAKNQEMAFDALMREDSRISAAIGAIENGQLNSTWINEKRRAVLKKVSEPTLKARVEKILGKS